MKFNITNNIFININDIFDFFIENEILKKYKTCTNCANLSSLKIQKRGIKKLIIYRCSNSVCRRRESITKSNLNINEQVHIIYLLLNGASYKQLNNFYGISDATILSIKKKLLKCYQDYCNARPVFLGGLGKVVEADETVLSRRGVIRYPTSTDDQLKDTVWIFGAIDAEDKSHFFYNVLKIARKTH
ncbi:hypothetical protein EQH57_0370 [Dictyocoela roeselum]|nr:hypothetical protein EQH57_0370 [Dictyocoela roeselum]